MSSLLSRQIMGIDPVYIAAAEVIEVDMPLLEPFVTGFGSTDSRRTVIVRVPDEQGRVGWGEAAALDHPYYLPETTSTTFSVIMEYALPLALAASPCTPLEVAAALSRIKGNAFARAGVEAAFWSLASLSMGQPLHQLFGGESQRISVGESVGIKPTLDETLDEVGRRLQEGYRRIKLKIRPGWDVEIVRGVRDAHGGIMLQVDANASYTLDQVDALQRLDHFGLACIEQPLGYDDLLGHAALQAQLETPICLDECLRSVADVQLALTIGACRNVNLKPGRLGGIVASLGVHDLCVEAGIPLWLGGMLESGIGRPKYRSLYASRGHGSGGHVSRIRALSGGPGEPNLCRGRQRIHRRAVIVRVGVRGGRGAHTDSDLEARRDHELVRDSSGCRQPEEKEEKDNHDCYPK